MYIHTAFDYFTHFYSFFYFYFSSSAWTLLLFVHSNFFYSLFFFFYVAFTLHTTRSYCTFILLLFFYSSFFFSFLILYIFIDARCFVKWVGTLLLLFIAYKTENGESFLRCGITCQAKKATRPTLGLRWKLSPHVWPWVLNLRIDLGSDHVWEFPSTNGTLLLHSIAYKAESGGSSLRCGITCRAKKATRAALGLRWKLSLQLLLLLLLCWDN